MICTIEIPKGSRYKYEVNKHYRSVLELERVVSMPYPANYGFIPRTLSDDGDPIDCFVISQYPISSLVNVKIELIGMIPMLDGGFRDDKLLAKIVGDDIDTTTIIGDIQTFLMHYKAGTEVLGYEDAMAAYQALEVAKMVHLEREYLGHD